MVHLQRYKLKTNKFQNTKHFPLLNSLFINQFSEFNPYSKDNNFKTYMKWAKRSPQLIGFLNIIATDIISDEIEFSPVNRSSGRNKVMRAETFWEMNSGVDVIEETIYDLLILGIGYNWLGVIDDLQLKEFCQVAVREIYSSLEVKELEFKAHMMVSEIKKNNTDKLVKKLRHIASSTVSLNSDEYEINSYVQRVGARVQIFQPEEIITFKLMPFDGKLYPLAPMESLLAEIYLLWLISQNYISYFENGGKPDNVFILPKELAGSKNHQYLIDTLKKYKKIQNKHGNLVFTGDLSVEKLMEVEHQMENKDLSLYIVSVLAMFYGIPVGRIPFLVGKAAAGGDSGGLSDSGYWRKISVWQRKIELAYNRKLWIPFFGVKMKFRRGYLQDEVRETQNDVQKTTVVEQRLNLGLWTLDAAGLYLGIDSEIIFAAQEEKKKRDEEIKSGMLNQNLNSNGNVLPHQDQRMKNKQKQSTQNQNQLSSGGKRINP